LLPQNKRQNENHQVLSKKTGAEPQCFCAGGYRRISVSMQADTQGFVISYLQELALSYLYISQSFIKALSFI